MDVTGKSDPFVVIRMGKEKKQTKVAKSTLNHDYKDEEFELVYNPVEDQVKREVDIEVWDYDSVGSNDLIGIASIDILPFFNKQQQVELFLQPQNEKKENSQQQKITIPIQNLDQKLGIVTFQLLYTDEQEWIKQFKEAQQKKKDEQNKMKKQRMEVLKKKIEEERLQIEKERKLKEAEDKKYPKGVVKFSNIAVRNLKKMDLVGKTDPYVVFKLGDLQKQTSVAKETLNYDYKNEEYEVVYDPAQMQGKRNVDVEVWDYDSVGNNDLIGTASVDV
ncbi:MAG: hypothetical protein EZS28_043694 [Streblomastix strix]|uniref:C2 domain-containing protein n=1 Tax=Streblomastix strix TaxID=222440 RepID=A0A5J4TSC1_9EUKA|nr:MAG: hypothetical protein EZS28_043694 [Streblomastix strix]